MGFLKMVPHFFINVFSGGSRPYWILHRSFPFRNIEMNVQKRRKRTPKAQGNHAKDDMNERSSAVNKDPAVGPCVFC